MLQIQGLQHTYNKYLKENFIITLLITKIKTYEKKFYLYHLPLWQEFAPARRTFVQLTPKHG